MEKKNISGIITIQLIGFQTPHGTTIFIFFLFVLIYCVTIYGNLLVITLVSHSKTLHSPMYFFLSHLSVSDIILTTDILPNTLRTIVRKETTMLFSGCLTQFYFFSVSAASECLLLTVMSYDRYLAICRPLNYTLSMNFQICSILVTICWVISIFIASTLTLTMLQLKFCGPNVIDHFFCDLDPILQLSCSDTIAVQLEATLMNCVFAVTPFVTIIVSYVYIIITIFKIPSITGRQKVFSTCSSHLTVVCIYYGTLVCAYLIPRSVQSWNLTKFVPLLYTVVTPVINPIIYSLRNKDFKGAVNNIYKQCLL